MSWGARTPWLAATHLQEGPPTLRRLHHVRRRRRNLFVVGGHGGQRRDEEEKENGRREEGKRSGRPKLVKNIENTMATGGGPAPRPLIGPPVSPRV